MAMFSFRFQVWIGFATVTTFVWLLACSSEHVRLHMSNLHKWFLADFVFVRLIISVGEQCSLCMCLFRLPDCEIDFSQTSHLNGFAPVWVSWCVLRCTRWLKDLPHFPQLKGPSPLWILEWYIRWCFLTNDLFCGFWSAMYVYVMYLGSTILIPYTQIPVNSKIKGIGISIWKDQGT